MTDEELRRTVFQPLVLHLRAQANSLQAIRRFRGGGIEGWFKVEVVAALVDRVESIRNKGADLILKDATEIELKAGCGLDAAHIRKGALKYGVPCLFLGYGGNLDLLDNEQVTLLAHAHLCDGHDNWTVGLIKPRHTDRE